MTVKLKGLKDKKIPSSPFFFYLPSPIPLFFSFLSSLCVHLSLPYFPLWAAVWRASCVIRGLTVPFFWLHHAACINYIPVSIHPSPECCLRASDLSVLCEAKINKHHHKKTVSSAPAAYGLITTNFLPLSHLPWCLHCHKSAYCHLFSIRWTDR